MSHHAVAVPQADGDKKSKQDAESKRVESNQKMLLLTNSLKKYKTLDVMGDLDDEEDCEFVRLIVFRCSLAQPLETEWA